MKIQWTAHLKDPEDKTNFERQVKSSKAVLERLVTLIEDRERAINTIETGVEIYKQPGWDALLAHYNGEKASLKYIKNLLDLDKQIIQLGD